MNKETLWQIYLKKNPHWATQNVHLSGKGLEKLVRQVWLQGYQHAKNTTNVEIDGKPANEYRN